MFTERTLLMARGGAMSPSICTEATTYPYHPLLRLSRASNPQVHPQKLFGPICHHHCHHQVQRGEVTCPGLHR